MSEQNLTWVRVGELLYRKYELDKPLSQGTVWTMNSSGSVSDRTLKDASDGFIVQVLGAAEWSEFIRHAFVFAQLPAVRLNLAG